MSRRDVASGR